MKKIYLFLALYHLHVARWFRKQACVCDDYTTFWREKWMNQEFYKKEKND